MGTNYYVKGKHICKISAYKGGKIITSKKPKCPCKPKTPCKHNECQTKYK